MNTRPKAQLGFTLIELMIVVAIIAILAAVAIPAYQDYTIRAQITEGLAVAAEAKASIGDFFSARGRLPAAASVAEAGLPSAPASISGNYVDQVAMTNSGGLDIRFGNKANTNIQGKILSLRPARSTGSSGNTTGTAAWICGNSPTPATHTPPAAPNDTSLQNKYLPASCRP